MQFIIADTFQESLEDLGHQARKRAKQAAFDFQMNPDRPGFQFHRVDRSEHDHFWSARVSDDLRFIVHHDDDVFVLCYVDHHDNAYSWAERRKLEVHPETESVQLVEVKRRTEEIVQQIYKQTEPPVFEEYEEEYLLRLGVPGEWVDVVQQVGETKLLKLIDKLPEEVGERLLRLADGEVVPVPDERARENPFEHPDSRRRFHLVEDEQELQQALEWPWERWIVFLHPEQRGALEKTYNGPAYVSGGAGTGKTVVAMHWAAQRLREDDEDVLFTTFSRTLASRLEHGMDMLLGEEADLQERLEIVHLHKLARDLWADQYERSPDIIDEDRQQELLYGVADDVETSHSWEDDFLFNEWDAIIDAWGIEDWETYRDVSRKGRGTPLGVKKRYDLWAIFERVRERMRHEGWVTWSSLCYDCIEIAERHDDVRWNHVVVDEAQDFGPAELQLLRALARDVQNNLFLVGDSGQRLYKRYFNWSDVGIHVVGRSTRLKINYRTTEQIRDFADELMPQDLRERGGTAGDRDAVSLLEGLDPDVRGFDETDREIEYVAQKLDEMTDQGYDPRDIAVFGRVRDPVLDERADVAADLADLSVHRLSPNESAHPETLALGTMHNAKGLEFKVVIVMGCEADLIPLSWALHDVSDEAEREDLLERERNLLYVAATRAREQLIVTYTGEPSPFLDGS